MSGAKYEMNKAKTTLKFYPGILINNNDVDYQFDCGLERSIGYFLEPLMIMSLFGKSNLQVTLQGITNDELDLSVNNYNIFILICICLTSFVSIYKIKKTNRIL